MNQLMLGTPTKAFPDQNPQFPPGIQELYTTIPEIQEINEKLKEDIPQVKKKLLSIQKKKAGLLQGSQQPYVSRITNVENIPWRQVPRKNGAHRSVQPPNGDKVEINQTGRPDQSLNNAQSTQMIPVHTLSNRQTDNLIIATRNEKQQSSQKSDLGVASSLGQQLASYQAQINKLIQEIHLLQGVNHSLELDGEVKSVKIIQLENQLSLKEKRISELVTREEELSKQLRFQIGRVDGKWACPNCGSLLLRVRQLEGEIQSYNRSHKIQIQRIAAMLRERNMQIEQLYAKYSIWNFREFSEGNQQRTVRITGENQQTDHTIFVPSQQSDNRISFQGGSNRMIIHRAPPNTLHDVNRSQQTDVNRSEHTDVNGNQYIFLTNGNGNQKYSINHQQNQASRESYGPQTLPSNSILQPQTYKEVPRSPFPQQNIFQGQTRFSHPGNPSQTNSNDPIVQNYIIQSNQGSRNQIFTPIGNPFRSPAQSPNHGQTQHIQRIPNNYVPPQISHNFTNQVNVNIQQNRTSSEVIIPQPPKQLPHFQGNNMSEFQQIKMNPIPANQAQGNNLLSPARMSNRPVPRIQQPFQGEKIRHQSPQSQSQTPNQKGPSIPQIPISQGNQAGILPQSNPIAPHTQPQYQKTVDINFGTYIDVLGEKNLKEVRRGQVRPSSIASREQNFAISANVSISGNSQPQYRHQPAFQPEKTPEPQREIANIFEQNSSEMTHTTYLRDPRNVNEFNGSIGASSFDKKPFQPERSSGREKIECHECYEMKQKLRELQEQSQAKIERLQKKLIEVNFKSASAWENLQTIELQSEQKIARLNLKIQQIQFNLRAAEEENIAISKKLAQKSKSKAEATSSYGESEDIFKKMSQTRNENFQQRLKIQEFESKEAKTTYQLKSLESRTKQLEAELTQQEDYYSKKAKETAEKARRQDSDLEQVSYKLNEKQAEIKMLRQNMNRALEEYERRERQMEQQEQAIKGLQKRELEYKKNLKSFAQDFDTYKKNLKEEFRENTEFLERSIQTLEEQLSKEQSSSKKIHMMLQQRTVEYEQMLQKMQQAEIKVDTLEQLLAGRQQELQRESEASHSNNAVNRAQINKANLEKVQQMSSRAEATQLEIYNLKQEIINIKLAKGSLETQLNSKDDQIKQLSFEISRLHIKLSSKERHNSPQKEFEIDNAMEASYQTTSRKSEGKQTMMESTVYELTQERDMTKSKLAQIQLQVGVLNEENKTLRATIQSLQQNITGLSKDTQFRASDKNKPVEVVFQNESQVRSLIELNQELNFKLKSLENACSKANQKNASNTARLNENDSQIRSLKEENQELSFKVNSLQKKLAQTDALIANQQLSTGNTKLTQNQSQINQLMQENINLSYKVKSLEKQIHQISSSQVPEEISNRLSQYQYQIQKLTEDNQLLQFEIESLKTQIHQISNSNFPKEEISAELAQYERQVQTLTEEKKQLQSAIKIYQMDTSTSTEIINTKLIEYENQISRLTEENKHLQFSVKSLQQDLNKSMSSSINEEINAKMTDYENQIEALMGQNKQLYFKVESLQGKFSNENEIKMSQYYASINADLTAKDDKIQSLMRENQQLGFKLELLQRNSNGESQIAQENQAGIRKLNEYESQIKDLIEANHQLNLTVGSLQRSIIEIENQKQAHPTANLTQQESLIRSLRQEIISLRSQIDLLQKNRTAVQGSTFVQSSTTSSQQLALQEATIRSLTDEITFLRSQIDLLQRNKTAIIQGSTFVQQSRGETGYSLQKEAQLKSLLQANENLNSKVEWLQREIASMGGVDASHEQLKASSINEQLKALSSKISEYEKAYNILGDQNKTANLKIGELNSTIAIFSEENEKMYGKYRELDQFKSSLEGRLGEYQIEVRRLEILNGQLNFRIVEMERQSSLGNRVQKAKFANETSLQQENRMLSEKNRAANLSIAQFEQQVREKNRLIKQFEEEMAVVNQQLTQTLKNNQDVTAMMQSLEGERQSLANTLTQFENQKAEQLKQLSEQYEQFIQQERATLAKSLNLSGEVNVVDLIRNYDQQLFEVCNERNEIFNKLCLAEDYIAGLQDRLNKPSNNTANNTSNNPTEENRQSIKHEAIDPIEQIKAEVQNTVSKIQWGVVQESPKKGGQSSLQPNNSELLEQVRNIQDQVLYLKLKLNEEAMRSLQFEQQYKQVSKAYLLLTDEMKRTISAKNQIQEVPLISSENISGSQILFDAQALMQGHADQPYRNTPGRNEELIIESRNSLVMGSGNQSNNQILIKDSRLLRTENNMYITTIARLEAELSSIKLNYTQALEDVAKRDKLIQAKLAAEKRYQLEIYEANKKIQQQSSQSSFAFSENFAPQEQQYAHRNQHYEQRINELKRERDSLAVAITTQNESMKQQIQIEVRNSLKHYVPHEHLVTAEEYIEKLLHEATEKEEQFKAMMSEFNKERAFWEANAQSGEYLNRIAELEGILTQERQQFADLSHDYQMREEIINQLNAELASLQQAWERAQSQSGENSIQITTVDQTHQYPNQDLEKQLAEYQRQREVLLYQSKQKDASINNLIRELEAQKTEFSSKLNSPRSPRSPREGLPENHAQYLESLKKQIAEYEKQKEAILGESSEKDEQIRAFSEKLKAQITAFEKEREIILQESLEKDRRIKQFSEGLRVKISEFDVQREAILNHSMQKDRQIQLFAKNLRRQIEEFERQRSAILEESLQKDKQIQEYSQRINAHFNQQEQMLSHHSAEALQLLENKLAESQQEKQQILATHVPYEKFLEAEHKVQSYVAQIQELEKSNNQIQSLQVQIQQLEKARSEAHEMYAKNWKELEAHYTQIQEAQNKKFQALLLELQNSRNQAQNNYTQLKQDTDIYIQNLKAESSQKEVQRLQVQIQELEKNRNQTQNLYAQAKQDLQDNSIRLQIAEIARKDIQNIQAQLYEAEKGKFEAQNMYEQLRKETESYIGQIEEKCFKDIQQLQFQIQELEISRNQVQSMHIQLKLQSEAYISQIQERNRNEILSLQAYIATLEQIKNQAKILTTNSELEAFTQAKETEKVRNEAQSLQAYIKGLEQAIRENQILYAQHSREVEDKFSQIQETDKNQYEARIQELEQGRIQAQGLSAHLKQELDSCVAQIQRLQTIQAQSQNQEAELKRELDNYVAQIQRLHINQAQSQNQNQEAHLKKEAELKQELDSCVAQIQRLQTIQAQIQNQEINFKGEIGNYVAQLQASQNEVNSLQGKILKLEKGISEGYMISSQLRKDSEMYAARFQEAERNLNESASIYAQLKRTSEQEGQLLKGEIKNLQGYIAESEMRQEALLNESLEKYRHIENLNEEIQKTAFHKKTHASQQIIPDSEFIEALQQQIEVSRREKEEIAVMLAKQREQFREILQNQLQKTLEGYTPKQKMLEAEGYITVVTEEVNRITGYAQSLEVEIGRLNFELETINQKYGKANEVLAQLERHQAILMKEKESKEQEIKSLSENLNFITRENEEAQVKVRQFEEMKLKATKQSQAILRANQSLEQKSVEAAKHSQLIESRLHQQNMEFEAQRQQYQQRLSIDSQQINSLLHGIRQLEQEKVTIINQKLASDEQLRVTADQLKNAAAETSRTLNKVKEFEQKQLKSTAENQHILRQIEAKAQQNLASVLNLEKAKAQSSEEQIKFLNAQLNVVATERGSLLKKIKQLQERFLKYSAENEASLKESKQLQEKKGEAAKQQELNTLKQQYENELSNCNRQITYLTQAIEQLEQQKVVLIQEKRVREEQVKTLTQKLVFATTESDNSLKKIKEIEERSNRNVAQNQAILQKTKDIEQKSLEKLKQSELALQRVKEYEQQIKIASLEGEKTLNRLKEVEEQKKLQHQKYAALERRIKELEDQKSMSEVALQASIKRANDLEEAIQQVKSEEKLEKQAIAEELINSKAELESMSKYIAESGAHMSEILNQSIEKDMQIQEFTDQLKTQVAQLKVQREAMILEIVQKQNIIQKLESIVNSDRAQLGQREEAYRAIFLQKDAHIVQLQNSLKKLLIQYQEEKEKRALAHIQKDSNDKSLPEVDLQVIMDQYAPKSKLLEAEQYIQTVVQQLNRLTGYAGQLEQEREFKNAEMLTMKESLEYQLLQALEQLKAAIERVNELQKALAEYKMREEQSLLDRRIIESSQGTQGNDRSKDIIHERAGSQTEELILGGLIEGTPMIDAKIESQGKESQREQIGQLKTILARLEQENEGLKIDSKIVREKLIQLSGQGGNEEIAQLKAQVDNLLQERKVFLKNSEERDLHIETVLQQAFDSSPFVRTQDEVDEREKLTPLKEFKPESIGQLGEASRFLAENYQTTTKQLNLSEEAHFFQGKEVSIIKPKKMHDQPIEISVANQEQQNIDSSLERLLDVRTKAYIESLKDEIARLQQSPRPQKIKPRSNPHGLTINISQNSHNERRNSGYSSRMRKESLLRHPSPQQINESNFLKGKLMEEEKQLFKYISSRDRKGEIPLYHSEVYPKKDYNEHEAVFDSPTQLLAELNKLEAKLQDAEIRISTLQAQLETQKIDFETERMNFDSYRVEMEDRMRVLQSQRHNLEENANISEELQQIAQAKLSDVAQKREIQVALLSEQIKLIGKDNTGQMELIEHQFNQKSEMEREQMHDKLKQLQRQNQELLRDLNTKIEEVAKKDREITVLTIEVREKEGIIAMQERDTSIQAATIAEMETKISDFQGLAAIFQQKTAEYQLERQSKSKQQSAEIDEVASLNDSLSSAKGNLFKKQASLSAAEKALAEANAKLLSLEQELATKQAKLIQKNEKLMLTMNLHSTEQAKWQIARREMEKSRKRIDESVALSEGLFQEKEMERAKLQERNEGLQVEVTEYRAMLLESQAELNKAKTRLLEVETLLAPLGPISEVAALMADKQQKIAELQIQNQEAISNIAGLEGKLFEASNRLIKLQTKSVEAESRSIEARNELIGAETELLEAEKKIAQMEAYIKIADQALEEKEGRILELEGGKLGIHSVGPQLINIAIHGESTPVRAKSNEVESPAEGQNMDYFRLKLADAEEHLANLQVQKLRFERLYNNIVTKFNRTNAEFAILIDNLRDSEIQKKEAVSQLNRIIEENQLSENQAEGQLGIQTKKSIHQVRDMEEKDVREKGVRQKGVRFESDSDKPNLIHSGNYEQQLYSQSMARRQSEEEAGEAALERMQAQIKTLQDQVRQYRSSSDLKSSEMLMSPKSKLSEDHMYALEGDNIEKEVQPATPKYMHSKKSEEFEGEKGLKEEEMVQLKEYLSKANSKIVQLEKERLQFEDQIAKLQQREQQLLKIIEKYKTDIKQSSERQEEAESHLIEIESCNLEMEKELEKITNEKRGLIAQLDKVKQAHDALLTQIAAIQRESQEHKMVDTLRLSEEEQNQLEIKDKKIEQLSAKNLLLEKHLKALQIEMESWRMGDRSEIADQTEIKLIEAQSQIKKLEKAAANYELINNQLKSQNDLLRKSVEQSSLMFSLRRDDPDSLLLSHDQDEKGLLGSPERVKQSFEDSFSRAKGKQIATIPEEQDYFSSEQKQSHASDMLHYESLRETIAKMISKLNNFENQVQLSPALLAELDDFVELKDLLTSLTMRLRSTSAAEASKTLKVALLEREISEVKQSQQALKQREVNLAKYLKEYQELNKELKAEQERVVQEFERTKAQLQDFEGKVNESMSTPANSTIQQNVELKQKLVNAEQELQKIRNSSLLEQSLNPSLESKGHKRFLRMCLEEIDVLEAKIAELDARLEMLEGSKSQPVGDKEKVLSDLQELEERLIENGNRMMCHQEITQNQLISLLREHLNCEGIKSVDKIKIEEYLALLEQQIIMSNQLHEEELQNYHKNYELINEELQQFKQFTAVKQPEDPAVINKCHLLEQINALTLEIDSYHKEANFRQRKYHDNMVSLNQELETIKRQYEAVIGGRGEQKESEQIVIVRTQIQNAMERTLRAIEQEPLISSNSVQVAFVHTNRFIQSEAEVQTEANGKAFLEYVLDSRNLDREDILLLKRRIAQIQQRNVKANINFLKQQEGKLEKLLLLKNESQPEEDFEKQKNNIMTTLANNLSHEQISAIFELEDTDEVLNRLNEALILEMEESHFKLINRVQIAEAINYCRRKYYTSETKLSQQITSQLLFVMTARQETQFLSSIEQIFKSTFNAEENFRVLMKSKDELYMQHKERMDEILNPNEQNYFDQSMEDLEEDKQPNSASKSNQE